MQPTFEELLQVIPAVAHSSYYQFVRVVLASTEGDVRFIEVSEGSEFRTQLEQVFQGGFLALGVLGWERGDEGWQAKSILFPWHEESQVLTELFERLCKEGVEQVRGDLERRNVN